jgi:tripartite-type tricarboxylate transporter receptor subunit TctC
MDRRQVIGAGLAACTLPASFGARAQAAYPSQPVKIIVPQPPGGGFDSVARQLAERLAPLLGQPVVVENKPGSGTVVGTEAAAKAAADGHTLLLGALSNLALNPGLYARLPYDPARDFKPVGLAVSYAYALIARKDLPLNTLQEVIQYARANPDKLNYASAGNGSGQHVAAAVLFQAAKVKVQHIPYKGAAPAYQDLIGGRVDLFFDLAPTARVQIGAGTVKALATSGGSRNPQHPELPTVREAGVDLELESWFGLFVPAKTPPPVLARLRSELQRVAASAEVQAVFTKAGGRPLALGADDTRKLLDRDLARWVPLVKAAGIKPD